MAMPVRESEDSVRKSLKILCGNQLKKSAGINKFNAHS